MTRHEEEDHLAELEQLADTAGAEVVDRLLQMRSSLDSATLIGKGMVHQLARRVIDDNVDLVIFDTDLSPVQLKNLEREFNRKVVDRSGLILDIFAHRARTSEAKIQVELAQLQYLLPRLTRQWTHLSRQEGGIGIRGPGETQLEVDRRAIRRRIAHLKSELGKIENQRNVRRSRRHAIQKAALVGYTNAGKSSLLNALADTDVFVEDRLFATLDATIRSVTLEEHRKILLIDTVGFIRKLPPHLVASFRSTLEESVDADILLHVVDVSHPSFDEQIGLVHEVLHDLEIASKPTLIIFNKVDLLDGGSRIQSLREQYPHAVMTSAVRGIGLENLRQEIIRMLSDEEVEDEVRIPVSQTKQIAQVYEMTHVIDKRYDDEMAVIRFRTNRETLHRIQASLGGS